MAMETADASTAADKSAASVYSRQQKIILFLALITEFFCCACLALPAPFLPRLVSNSLVLLVYFSRNTQYKTYSLERLFVVCF